MLEKFQQYENDLLTATGFDECIIGMGYREGQAVLIYSADKIIESLDMYYDDAVDYFEFNIAGAYMGPKTPMFVWEIR